MHAIIYSSSIDWGVVLVVDIVILLQKSATSPGWTPGTSPHYLPNSHLWLQEVACAQITPCCLHNLMKTAYSGYCTETAASSDEVHSFEAWCASRKHQSPQFQLWYLVLSMELEILSLIRSFREGNFDLYRQSLVGLTPYFFANNNVNYARWFPIHLRDMSTLGEKHPQLAHAFQRGASVVHKSSRDFSAMAIDQAHEQGNSVIKADGGAIGVTEDPSALRGWMIAGPKVSQLATQY